MKFKNYILLFMILVTFNVTTGKSRSTCQKNLDNAKKSIENWKCDCSDGKHLCSFNKTESPRCIEQYKICNGFKDCPYGDDELGCECGPTPPIDFGSFQLTKEKNMKIGSTAKLQCQVDYAVIGNDSIICFKNGRWEFPRGFCVAKECSGFPNVDHGSFELAGSSKAIGERALLLCEDGYFVSGDNPYFIYCQQNLQWTPSQRVCSKGCDYPDILNGFLKLLGSSRLGTKANIQCCDGYELSVFETVKCVGNSTSATWNVPAGACIPKQCCQLPTPAIGAFRIISGDGEIGSIADIICPANTVTCGNTQITCKSGGTWSDATGISCYDPSDILEGYLSVVQSSMLSQASGVAADVVDDDFGTCSETGNDDPAFWQITFQAKRQISIILLGFKAGAITTFRIFVDGQQIVESQLNPTTGDEVDVAVLTNFNSVCGQVIRFETILSGTLNLCELIIFI